MGMEALITIHSPSNLVVHGIHYDHGEKPFIKSLIKHLEEALSIGGLHGFIIFVLFNLPLHSKQDFNKL